MARLARPAAVAAAALPATSDDDVPARDGAAAAAVRTAALDGPRSAASGPCALQASTSLWSAGFDFSAGLASLCVGEGGTKERAVSDWPPRQQGKLRGTFSEGGHERRTVGRAGLASTHRSRATASTLPTSRTGSALNIAFFAPATNRPERMIFRDRLGPRNPPRATGTQRTRAGGPCDKVLGAGGFEVGVLRGLGWGRTGPEEV